MFLTFFSGINFKYFISDTCNYTEAAWKDRERYKSSIGFFFLFCCITYIACNLEQEVRRKMCGKEHRYISANSWLAVFSFGSLVDMQNLKRIGTFQIRESRMAEGEFYFHVWIVNIYANSHMFMKMFAYDANLSSAKAVYIFMCKASRSSQWMHPVRGVFPFYFDTHAFV